VAGQVLARALTGLHHVELATDAEAALARVRPGQYDVAIIDLGMPGLSGQEVGRRLEALDPALARVLFTGWELAEDDPRRQAFDLQLAKPVVSLEALKQTVAQAVELRDRRAAAPAPG